MNVQTAAVESLRKFSIMEENAIYYAAGYVMCKLLKKYMKMSNESATMLSGALLYMVGQDIVGNVSEVST